ncbi:adenylosuccinate lyase [Limosilactobacillus fermentum]|uniref:adenylosuccinate lyase n=1 Tax=Limosilactobacillus fermentum TaxID=1613 RepID=UPI0012B11319|nr:adenylosuccinate lyase [Limosilactobacillus fermentum]QSH33988.1 adenylosuccinate lyase [Limosilactobacillus fermentum]QSH36031.1 adenylosuccinate lyase [Limosilactobacillus fermentum]QSH38067.1 adenylosuccinate lyase [Limosilactobacillus fermentum]
MIDRYTRPEMKEIWSDKARYQCWLDVEIAADEAWSKLGHIPAEDVEKICQNATFTVEGINEIEAVTHHDVIAFTRDVSKSLGPERKWVHYGLTSTDVVDTAQGLQLKKVNDILRQDIQDFMDILADRAREFKYTVCMGRTHGIHAEPTTFGLKLARWYSEMKRNQERFEHAAKGVEAGKISGAVGTFAEVDPQVEAYVCQKLGLRPQEISTQVLPRDLHAEYVAAIALVGTALENMATEVRSLQRTEIHEVEEHFAKGQKGSSAMPHKRNPIGSENICGCARVLRGNVVTAYEDVTLWHERDISHSSAERMILPDSTALLDYMLHRFGKIIKNLDVFPDRMKHNMDETLGLIYSGRVLLKLVNSGMTREDAYDLIQKYTAKCWADHVPYRPLLEADPIVAKQLTKEDLDDAFDYHWHLRHVDDIFHRVGLD